jgi:tetratricopeptide (TPR) repeat protein
LIVPAAPGWRAAAVTAGMVELLRRRSRCALSVATALDPKLEDVHRVEPDAIAAQLAACDLVVVGGRLAGEQLLRAAEIVFMARMIELPVALIAVQVPIEPSVEPALLSAVVQAASSVTAADAETSQRLAAIAGRRIEVVAPIELLAPIGRATAAGTSIGCEAAFLATCTAAELRTLGSVAQALGARWRIFDAPLLLPEGGAPELAPVESWASVAAAVAGCALILGEPDDALQIAGTVAGVPALAWTRFGNGATWHQRCGAADAIVRRADDTERLTSALRGLLAIDRDAVARRAVSLRTVAWRALGALAEVRGQAWVPAAALDPAVAAVVARACERLVQPALDRGDAVSADAVLTRWEGGLAGETAWARARARSLALLSRDAEAVAVLEHATGRHPRDRDCSAELARAWTRCGEYERACAAWESVAALDVLDPEPHAAMAHLRLLQGNATGALAAWSAALMRDPLHAASLRAVHALLDTEPRQEMEFWAPLCGLEDAHPSFWQAHGLAAARAEEWAIAEASLQRAVALDPQSHPAHAALRDAIAQRDPTAVRPAPHHDAPVAGAETGRL